jgi:hypothetical protein
MVLRKLYHHSSCMTSFITEHNAYTHKGNIYSRCRRNTSDRYTVMLKQRTHRMWLLKLSYAPKFVSINTSLSMIARTFAIYDEKFKVITTSHL